MRSLLPVIVLTFGAFISLYGPVHVKAEIDAASLFKTHCIPCHGEDGKGTDLGKQLAAMAEGVEFPDFTNAEWQSRKTDERMIEQIKNGSPDRMFPFKDKLSEEEIKALVAYVRGFPSR
ncbi:MAG: c-type cytochrome [Candidatus Brocadiales bacterium]